jgi:hypothetical protein
MEQNHNQKKTNFIGRILLICLLGFIALVIVEYVTSPVLMSLRKQKPLVITFLTSPPALAKYYPKQKKIQFITADKKIKLPQDLNPRINAVKDTLLKQYRHNHGAEKFFVPPRLVTAEKFQADAKNYITGWHSNPHLIYGFFKSYRKAAKSKRCNLNILEFITLLLKLHELKVSDILIGENQKGEDKYLLGGLEDKNTPVLIKVFNATETGGLAKRTTEYLRFLNGRNIIKTDVIGYGNWYKSEKKSIITAARGRFLELSALAKKIGLESTEILFKRNMISFAEATLVIGEDIKLPKNGNRIIN